MTIQLALGLYLIIGVIALVSLDLFTGRVRKRLKAASYDTQKKMMVSGSYVGPRTALVIIVLALWIFWPFAIYGAIRG